MRRTLFPPQVAVLALLATLFAGVATAAAPVISAVDLRGLQIGSTNTITVTGRGLLPAPQLALSLPIAEQKLLEGATDSKATFEVKLAAGVQPGVYNLWVRSSGGFSAPVQMAVDHLPNQAFAAEITQLPVALSGVVSGSNSLQTTFTGKSGQELLLEAEAARLGGKLRPVIHLYDANRLQIGWAMPRLSLAGDARLKVRLPADGVYTVEVHDAEYAAAAPNHLRLKIGVWQFADRVFPPAVPAGSSSAVELIGNFNASTSVKLPSASFGTPLAAPWPDPSTASGPRPRVLVSNLREAIETPDGKKPQPLPPLPCAVSGRFQQASDEDVYRLTVQPEMKLRLEVFADRLGAAVDAVLEVRDETGKRLATNDDVAGTADPLLEYTVPKETETLLLAVRDAVGAGGERAIYRLVATAAEPEKPAAEYELTIAASELNVPQSGSLVVPVLVERSDYEGPISLKFTKLPAGVTATGETIPPAAGGTLVTLTGNSGAAAGEITSLTATSTAGPRSVAVEGHPLKDQQPWLQEELAVAITAPHEQQFTSAIGKFPADASLVKGAKLTVPLSVVRPEGDFGPVRVTLLTSQNVPIVNNRRNANQAIRVEKALEIAADKLTAETVLIIPPDLPETPYELAFRTELLSKDKRSVLADVYTPVQLLKTINPVAVKLTGSSTIDAQLDAKTGATVELVGSVERRGEVTGDVTVTLSDLPRGVAIPKQVVKAEETEFRLEIKLPANTAVGDLPPLKLFGTILPDPKNTRNLVRSAETPITLRVLAAPEPEKK